MTGPTLALVLPSFAGGGAERAMLTLAGALAAEGVAVRLIVLNGQGPLKPPHGVEVRDLACPRLRWALPRLVRALKDAGVIVPAMGHLNLALLALRPLLGRVVPREANMPRAALANTSMPGLFRLGYRVLYPRAGLVLCNARAVAVELSDFAGVDPARIAVVPNPVDEAAVRGAAQPIEREPGLGRRFVAAGRLVRQKGFDRLIDLAQRLAPEDRITILGDGPDRAGLDALARRTGGRVRLPGFVARPWPWYAGADAFVLPSRWEGMSNAALEALACGTPVIAAPEAGGMAELEAPVTLAPFPDGFLAALLALAPAALAAPRPSLLPPRFQAGAAAAAFRAAVGI